MEEAGEGGLLLVVGQSGGQICFHSSAGEQRITQ